MRITNVQTQEQGDRARVAADVVWEQANRPARTLHFEVPTQFADYLSPHADAFLLACIMPAIRHSEQRVQVEGSICPILRNGLVTVMRLMRSWYPRECSEISIEPSDGFVPRHPPAEPRAACFLSGGVDSMATLRQNRLDLTAEHPAFMRDCLLVYGFDIGGKEQQPRPDLFESTCRSLGQLCAKSDATLVPIWTNIKYLDDDWSFWSKQFHGAALAAVATALSGKVSAASIGSSDDVTTLVPWGSHPLVDPWLSSGGLSILHDGGRLIRYEKLALIAGWPEGLQYLRVCVNPHLPADQLNCGRCEKCIRTMLGLLALGKLKEAATFPRDDLSPALLRDTIRIKATSVEYAELLSPLEAVGRGDLAKVIRSRLRRRRIFGGDSGPPLQLWRKVRRLDYRYMRGNVQAVLRRLGREQWLSQP